MKSERKIKHLNICICKFKKRHVRINMPILKFWIKEGVINLDNFRMENISKDPRTLLLKKDSFMDPVYKVEENVYMVINDLFFSMAKIMNKGPEIHAMLLEVENKKIIIISSNNYVFWNGKSIEPKHYEIKV